MLFSAFSDHCFFDFGPIFKCHTLAWKELIGFPDAELHAKSFEKKIRFSRSSPDPENSRCGHQQPYNFFSVFADFRTAQENQNCFVQCRRISCNWGKKFLIISKEKIFIAD